MRKGLLMDRDVFAQIVARAALAPSIHNAQPTRWRLNGDIILVVVDLSVTLPHVDPTDGGIALSCGAAVEATVLALSQAGYAATVQDVWAHNDRHSWSGHRIAVIISYLAGGAVDGLAIKLPARFTWRGAFSAASPALYGWTRTDTAFVLDQPTKAWLAGLNDAASIGILRQAPFRKELLGWFRLSPDHPRAGYDGMNLAALGMTPRLGVKLRLGFGPLWPFLDMLGRTGPLTAEADVTQTAPVIACFHRPVGESPIASGRAYLRLLLEAAGLGFACWPMAALTDDTAAADQIMGQISIPPDRQLIQVIRFGVPTGPQPQRARCPLSELIP
ncbi:MAG: hypothetical protein ACJAXK_001944 [Yoonia sp.]